MMTGADGSGSIEHRTVEIRITPTPARCTASFMFFTRNCVSPPETRRGPGKTSERVVEILGQAREHHAFFRYPQCADDVA
jgi:hypothetical protein